MTDFFDDPFHRSALAAGFVAWAEGKLHDSLYVRELCYRMYEESLAENSNNQSGMEGKSHARSAENR